MPTEEAEVLKRRLERERAARKQAETLLKKESRAVPNNQNFVTWQTIWRNWSRSVPRSWRKPDQALEANRAKSVFLANMSHELHATECDPWLYPTHDA